YSLDSTVNNEFQEDGHRNHFDWPFSAIHIPHIPHIPRSNGPWSASAVPPPTPATRHGARTPFTGHFFPCLSHPCRQCPEPRHPHSRFPPHKPMVAARHHRRRLHCCATVKQLLRPCDGGQGSADRRSFAASAANRAPSPTPAFQPSPSQLQGPASST